MGFRIQCLCFRLQGLGGPGFRVSGCQNTKNGESNGKATENCMEAGAIWVFIGLWRFEAFQTKGISFRGFLA